MRRFCSYGPVEERKHFTVSRKKLVDSCVDNLVGYPEEGGHYFTIWAPRQTGKTWLIHQAKKTIESRYPETFALHCFSLGDLRGMHDEPPTGVALPPAFADVLEMALPGNPVVQTWKDFRFLFSTDRGIWKQPLILFIDEVDTAPAGLIDLIVGRFREMYLDRGNNRLHGLALAGVRAVLGVESERGSPFNIQRSLHVPNFTSEEVAELFRQYREESGQEVEPAVVESVYESTRGQPGLVGWFGELLTETCNPGTGKPLDMDIWHDAFRSACVKEWNNTVLNLVKKARGEYRNHVLELFTRSDIPFTIDAEWCSYLYLHGIIDYETVSDAAGGKTEICRFANPFIQRRLYNALTLDLIGERSPILALEPLDALSDVFDKPEPDLAALLVRYKKYLVRLKASGLNPWKDQPRRADMHLREAVGHFHLYFWLKQALEGLCVVSPEFPTGNGRVDLHLQCGGKSCVIEVKSYKSQSKLETAKIQAAGYARNLKLSSIAVALFAPVEEEEVLAKLSGQTVMDGVNVVVTAIGWV